VTGLRFGVDFEQSIQACHSDVVAIPLAYSAAATNQEPDDQQHLQEAGSGNLTAAGWSSLTDRKPYRHRFPLSIIQYALWLDHHFFLSQRDVQELLQKRGIQVSHETLRQWNIKFAPCLPKNSDTGNPDGVPGGFWTRSASRSGAEHSGCSWPEQRS